MTKIILITIGLTLGVYSANNAGDQRPVFYLGDSNAPLNANFTGKTNISSAPLLSAPASAVPAKANTVMQLGVRRGVTRRQQILFTAGMGLTTAASLLYYWHLFVQGGKPSDKLNLS